MDLSNPRPERRHQATALRLAPAPAHRRRTTIALLLTGRNRPEDPAVADFLRQSSQEGIDLEGLWLASLDDRPIAAALLVPCAGRTGAVFLGPLANEAAVEPAGDLLAAMVDQADQDRIRIVQALLDPQQQQRESRAFAHAGFERLAHLLYMEHSAPAEESPLLLPEGYDSIPWSEQARPQFEEAILASYQQTLDCPGLLGLRPIEDIIEGHMSAGKFQPPLWRCIRRAGEPVGAMLLNPLPQREAMELVYLGLAPAVRGQKLSRRLMEHGLGLCRRYGARSMVLAVDEANTPAVGLYQKLGFRGTARKLALARPVPAG